MLENIELFSGLDKKELSTLEMFCQEREVAPGDIVFNIGEESTAMYILSKGLMMAYIGDKILGKIGSGGIFGEMALFSSDNLRTASVKALEPSKIIILLSFSIKELEKTNPEIIEKIKQIIKQRDENNKNLKDK